MKKMVIRVVCLCALASVLVLSCVSTGETKAAEEGTAFTWGTFSDAANQGSSRISLVEDVENINGEILMTYSISGEITNQYEYGYAGWYAFPDDPTRELLKKIKNFSFKVVGDGQTYFVMFTTSDIEDSSFYRTKFTTKKDQEITVNVKVGSLAQPDDWGIKKKFNQDNAMQIQFQTTNNGKPGTFKLKVYDLKLYQ